MYMCLIYQCLGLLRTKLFHHSDNYCMMCIQDECYVPAYICVSMYIAVLTHPIMVVQASHSSCIFKWVCFRAFIGLLFLVRVTKYALSA